jgi:hypothetical protein
MNWVSVVEGSEIKHRYCDTRKRRSDSQSSSGVCVNPLLDDPNKGRSMQIRGRILTPDPTTENWVDQVVLNKAAGRSKKIVG